MPFLRLRQICLVAHDLDKVVGDLCTVLDLQVCHRDPGVGRFGLHNALMRIGTSFIEVVAPIRDGTAAGRHLQRLGGDGGYMVILDTDDIGHWQRHVRGLAVRVASLLEAPGYTGLQLHPADTGGALLEINHTPGGQAPGGLYWPAGPHWQSAAPGGLATSIAGVTLQSADALRLARRWSDILQRPLAVDAQPLSMVLDDTSSLQFVAGAAGSRDGFARVEVRVTDKSRVLDLAVACGCAATASAVRLGGVWFAIK
jgi:hypothetical protein